MEWYVFLAIMIGGVASLIVLGMPVAFAFLGVNVVLTIVFVGGLDGLNLVVANAASRVAVFTLVPIPLFMLMGELFFRTGLAMRVFDAFDLLLGRVPGRLAFLTVGGGTFFSALTGSSLANTAMLGTLLMPDMLKRGYKRHMVIGPIIGTGGLAIIIPPSGLAVLLGSLANVSIGALLIAGLLPGLILATFYGSVILIQVMIDPTSAPQYKTPSISLLRKLGIIVTNLLPMGLVIFSVVGMILLGWATPTESAAFGAASVIVLGLLFRVMTWEILMASLVSACRVAAMLFLIIIGSSTFSQMLAYTGASTGLIEWVSTFDLSVTLLVVCMFLALLFLGTFMEQASMLMLTIPIFFPLALAVDIDPVWFGIVMLLGLEMSLTTPPFGLLLFVMLGVAPKGTTLWQVVGAALPYLACDAALLILIIAYPSIVLYLPNLMS
ncbi:MAG: TRAP transporter large permease [Alphaproteobacteria bacterium]|jgi:tripartite ATP-independent transporter DctM subunit